MPQQSSRIIWGHSKNPGSNELGPVELYDGNYIYVSGNYAIHSNGNSGIAEDYHLYLCTAEETGGTWNSDDWSEQKGVKNWYLISGSKIFKKGARTIKEDSRGDFSTLKLYKCIVDKSSPAPQKGWVPEEWEVVLQDVGIQFIPRDHKDVYFDDGKNKEKWHVKMWYIPPYFDDIKEDLEIVEFQTGRQYHYGDRVLRWSNADDRSFCYKYIDSIPRAFEDWNPIYWSRQDEVLPYETFKMYRAGIDEVIKRTIEGGYQQVAEHDPNVYYDTGCYCIKELDHERDKSDLWKFDSTQYVQRIIRGDVTYALFRNIAPAFGDFNTDTWVLAADESVHLRVKRKSAYDSDEEIWIWDIMNGRARDIKTFEFGQPYDADDLVIWTTSDDDSTMQLYHCKVDLRPDASLPRDHYVPYKNDYFWESELTQRIDIAQIDRVYLCIHAMTSAQNDHWIPENWKVITQKVDPNYGYYGLIWEKYPLLNGGAYPFYFPIAIGGVIYGNTYQDYRLDNFFPFSPNESDMKLGPVVITKWSSTQKSDYGVNKIIDSLRYFYAYHSTASVSINSNECLSDNDILISSNSEDWHTVELDGQMASKFEIIPCEDGFIYARVKNGSTTSVYDISIVKVIIGPEHAKVSEVVLEDIIDYTKTSNVRNLFLNGFFIYGEPTNIINVYNYYIYDQNEVKRTLSNDDGNAVWSFFAFVSSKKGQHLYILAFREEFDWVNETHTRYAKIIVVEDATITHHEYYNETIALTEDFECPLEYPYVVNDAYLYFGEDIVHTESVPAVPVPITRTTYWGKFYRLDLNNFTFEKFHEGLPQDDRSSIGAVMNIPYYKHESCYLSFLNVHVTALNLHNRRVYDEATGYQGTIENGIIDLPFDPAKYYNTAHGVSNSGSPANTSDLFISDYYELVVVGTGATRHYHVCVYVPGYTGDAMETITGSTFASGNSFFWLFSNEDDGGPFYGGPDGRGF